MPDSAARLPAIVLAGERPGGNALAREHGLRASVLIDVAGMSCLERVLVALRACPLIDGGVLVGPAGELVHTDATLRRLLQTGDFRWLEPASGPSASALAAADLLDRYPALLTAGDHALLDATIIDSFCRAALASNADFVAGLVPHAVVKARFPGSRRTLLKFNDGTYCGSNLFLLRTAAATAALRLWQALEQERKRPWKIAARLGPGWLLRYMAGTLSVTQAFELLSARSGCRVGFVPVDDPRAAVDVDSSADLALARQLLSA